MLYTKAGDEMREYLVNHANKNRVSFHMPGHKGSAIYRMYGYDDFLERMMECDITEIIGADNLYHPEGIIKEAQELYAKLYGAKESFLLVNGTTGGILAAVMSSVKSGKKLLMSRGCHKSVYNALKLGRIKPVYLQPKTVENVGIIGGIDPADVEKALASDKDIEAVILPSPNYYGICSDIKEIARVVHKHKKILIVDQAHGAHLKFFHKFGFGEGMPMAAEDCGADIVINSIHKTLASFTQSAVLNVMTDRVDLVDLFEKIQLVQTTSPSYLLMASLAINAEIIKRHGEEQFRKWKNDIDWFYEEAKTIEGFVLVDCPGLDKTKLNMSLEAYGIDGYSFEQYLYKKKVLVELVTGNIVMAMTGIGNVRFDYQKLYDSIVQCIESVKEAGSTIDAKEKLIANKRCKAENSRFVIPKPGKVKHHGEAKEAVALENAKGRVCATNITPYPPGIPFACPGEELTSEIIDEIIRLRNEHKLIYGVSDSGQIHVYK